MVAVVVWVTLPFDKVKNVLVGVGGGVMVIVCEKDEDFLSVSVLPLFDVDVVHERLAVCDFDLPSAECDGVGGGVTVIDAVTLTVTEVEAFVGVGVLGGLSYVTDRIRVTDSVSVWELEREWPCDKLRDDSSLNDNDFVSVVGLLDVLLCDVRIVGERPVRVCDSVREAEQSTEYVFLESVMDPDVDDDGD